MEVYFRQLIQAVKFCHSHNVAHRDIKPENIMLSESFDLKVLPRKEEKRNAIVQCIIIFF